MIKKRKHIAGFTLLELLVVVSIIGILMAMGVVAYSTAQKKGRDAKRRADMEAIQDAQEQLYAETGSYANNCNPTDLASYLQVYPSEPKPGWSGYNCVGNASGYCSCADLEDNKGNADSTGNPCTFTNDGDGGYHCVGNLQ